MLGVVVCTLLAGLVMPAQSSPQESESLLWDQEVARGNVDSDYAAAISKLLQVLKSGSSILPADLSISEEQVLHVSSISSHDAAIPFAREIERGLARGRNGWLPAAASAACTGKLFGQGEQFEIPTRCRQGFGRHSNGRCYRVVDELPQYGILPLHPYQVTRESDCYGLAENYPGYYKELESQGRLDVCDEDGGCFFSGFGVGAGSGPGSGGNGGFGGGGVIGGGSLSGCVEGYVLDSYDTCRQVVNLPPRDNTRRPPKQGRGKRDVSNHQSDISSKHGR